MANLWDEIGDALKGVVPVVATVAPTIATALGGPLAGLAVQSLSAALLGKADGTPAEVSAALASATPDQFLALRKEEDAFKLRLEELGVEREKLAAGDRDSARQREAKTGDSLTPRVLAMVLTVGFFGILGVLMGHDIPQGTRDVVVAMTGVLGTGWTAMVMYYFGSSAGSDNTAALAALAGQGRGGR